MGRRLDRSHDSPILPRNGVLPDYAQRVQPEAYPSDTGRVDAGFPPTPCRYFLAVREAPIVVFLPLSCSGRSFVATRYDRIGRTYSSRREADPRIAAAIEDAVDGCASVLNVGAGTGSYEPQSGAVIALEPSRTMIAQRRPDAAPVVQGYAECLPFRDGSFDAVLGVLTVHHWKNQEKGFSECARVARSRVVFLTVDFDVGAQYWMFDYFPELIRADRQIFPGIDRFADSFDLAEIIPIPIPADCRDGFLGAYWKRPQAFLDPLVRESISTFSKIGNVDSNLVRLKKDIDSGAWGRRYLSLSDLDVLDLGYRLIIARAAQSVNKPGHAGAGTT
jgi:SAM-dependent methyltransferase